MTDLIINEHLCYVIRWSTIIVLQGYLKACFQKTTVYVIHKKMLRLKYEKLSFFSYLLIYTKMYCI